MKAFILLLTLSAAAFTSGCSTANTTQAKQAPVADHPLAQKETLFEILRYVYLWHFDESYSVDAPDKDSIEMRIREETVALDEGDQSRFAEVWLPQVKMLIHLKKANYSIPELDLNVRNESFKIQNVSHQAEPNAPENEYLVMTFSESEVVDYLVSTRNLKRFPDEVLRKNLREAMIRHEFDGETEVDGTQVIYVSPISPVSNDLWVYHENFKRLIRFAADMDLNNPDYWSKTPVRVDVFDLESAVVVMEDERAGSDAYLTKDFTGRALFNCLILGMRLEVSEEEAKRLIEEVRQTTQ